VRVCVAMRAQARVDSLLIVMHLARECSCE
jgi:hypothetical protein